MHLWSDPRKKSYDFLPHVMYQGVRPVLSVHIVQSRRLTGRNRRAEISATREITMLLGHLGQYCLDLIARAMTAFAVAYLKVLNAPL